jgi:hypothetical protein
MRYSGGSPMRQLALLVAVVYVSACSNAARERQTLGVDAVYDTTTGRLSELRYDADKNGRIDTWTAMDGARPISARIDRNEDGTPERWEYYDALMQLARVAFSRSGEGRPDAWAYPGAGGTVERIEISSVADQEKLDRWEHYDASGLVTAEEDADGDGVLDQWETFEGGALKAVAFDETGDGRPDRQMTYEAGALVLIETAPDASGRFMRRIAVSPRRRDMLARTQQPARQPAGGIEGVVKDAAQQSLPGVWVQARAASGDLVATARTDSTGSFSLSGLRPGTYTIEVLDAADNIIGTSAAVAIAAGRTATVTVAAAPAGAIAAAAGGGLSLFGLGPIGTVAVLGAAAAGTVAIQATQNDASPSR